MKTVICVLPLCVLAIMSTAAAQEKAKPPAQTIKPTHAEVSYGDHKMQVIDFWQAER